MTTKLPPAHGEIAHRRLQQFVANNRLILSHKRNDCPCTVLRYRNSCTQSCDMAKALHHIWDHIQCWDRAAGRKRVVVTLDPYRPINSPEFREISEKMADRGLKAYLSPFSIYSDRTILIAITHPDTHLVMPTA